MKLAAALAIMGILSPGAVVAAPRSDKHVMRHTELHQMSGRYVSGLNPTQSRHAAKIIAQAKSNQVGIHGCQTAIAIALTESGLRILANVKVPQSLLFDNEGTGSDQDSIGLFQMRAEFYPDIQCSMQAECSSRKIFDQMKAVDGWKSMDVGALCQKVQRSEIPSAYLKHTATAAQVCKNAGGF